MKIKATKKSIIQQSGRVLAVGYCALQTLLKYKSPFAYSAGIHGWSCDYYNAGDGLIISTGYAPAGTATLPEQKIIKEYEQKAQNARTAAEIDTLYNEFIAKIKGGEQ